MLGNALLQIHHERVTLQTGMFGQTMRIVAIQIAARCSIVQSFSRFFRTLHHLEMKRMNE